MQSELLTCVLGHGSCNSTMFLEGFLHNQVVVSSTYCIDHIEPRSMVQHSCKEVPTVSTTQQLKPPYGQTHITDVKTVNSLSIADGPYRY